MHLIFLKSSCVFVLFFAERSPLLKLNLTTVTAMKFASESSITSMLMVSNGMTLPATIKNLPFVNSKLSFHSYSNLQTKLINNKQIPIQNIHVLSWMFHHELQLSWAIIQTASYLTKAKNFWIIQRVKMCPRIFKVVVFIL